MNQPKKTKGFVVEIFHEHQNTLDCHVHETLESALGVLGGNKEAGNIYHILSKHSSDADGFTYVKSDGEVAPKIWESLIDADQARSLEIFKHPGHKEPGKVIAIKKV